MGIFRVPTTAAMPVLLLVTVGCGGGDGGNEGIPGFTWIDSSSGLTWQNPRADDSMGWEEAKQYCVDLNLDGGGWHLPSIDELRSLIRGCPGTELGSTSCSVEEGGCLDSSCIKGDLCVDCLNHAGPANGCYWPDEMLGGCWWYWSSTAEDGNDDVAWGVFFTMGSVTSNSCNTDQLVRCVR